MITLHFLQASPTGTAPSTTIQGKPGKSLMEAAVAAQVPGIAADCGGLLTCATCHVMLDEPWRSAVPPASAEELSMLDFTAVPRTAGSRLSCQITLTAALEGLTATLPASQY